MALLEKYKFGIYLFLICALTFAIYANCVHFDFVWDDYYLIQKNIFIRDFQYLPKLFFTQIGESGPAGSYHFYRPVLMVSLMLDYYLWGENPMGYHLTTIIIHLLSVLCVFWLIKSISRDKYLAVITCLIFAVNPLHSNDVVYITGRSGILASLFMTIGFILYIKPFNGHKIISYIGVLLCYLLSVMSKESGIVLPLMIMAYHYAFRIKISKKKIAGLLTIGAGYLIMRIIYTGASLGLQRNYGWDIIGSIPGFFVALLIYVKLLFFPLGFHYDYGQPSFYFNNWMALSGLAIFITLLISAVKVRVKRPLMSFFIMWFFIGLAPYSNILYPASSFMTARYLYIPSISFFVLIAFLIKTSYDKKRIGKTVLSVCVAGIVLFYSIATIKNNRVWRTPISLYERLVSQNPNNCGVISNLAHQYFLAGYMEGAILLDKMAILLEARSSQSYHLLGVLYMFDKQYDRAERAFKKALDIYPDYALSYQSLGVLYIKEKRIEEAQKMFEKAIAIQPYLMNSWVNLASVHSLLGDSEKAQSLLEHVVAIDKNDKYARLNLCRLYRRSKQYDKAVNLLLEGQKDMKEFKESYVELILIELERNNIEKAREYFKKAEEFNIVINKEIEEKINGETIIKD